MVLSALPWITDFLIRHGTVCTQAAAPHWSSCTSFLPGASLPSRIQPPSLPASVEHCSYTSNLTGSFPCLKPPMVPTSPQWEEQTPYGSQASGSSATRCLSLNAE